jgi:SAM-dependent methyltransferase
MAQTDYADYLLVEWRLFHDDRGRAIATLAAVDGISVARVLDVGCGAGQELFPFVTSLGSYGVGIDITVETGQALHNLFAATRARIVFTLGSAEYLPFLPGAFDVVVCRIALPYMNNRQALSEIARVLRPGGRLLLKIHAPHYYVAKIKVALRTRNWLSAIHATRVLAAGVVYHLTGKQLRNRLIGHEVFQSGWRLRKELKQRGMRLAAELPDSNRLSPSFVCEKVADNR